MNLKRIIKEEVNDFDWVKESNPIQCKDLKGYYFYHGSDPRKFMINDVQVKLPKGYNTDNLKVHYTWWDSHSDDFDWNQMDCDTFIHRVKLGDYKLYSKNGDVIEPRNLAYTDNTFDDDERKEIWEQGELKWIKDIVSTKLANDEDWILVNDIDRESISEGHEIQKYLFDLGYDWGIGDSLKDFCIYTIYHYGTIQGGGNQIYYGDGCRRAEVRISARDIGSGKHMVYYWSDLKPKTIKEENEFDWIRDIEPPSFDSLVGKALEFDPYIDNMVDLKKILELLSGMGFTYGTWVDDLSFEDEEEEIVGLYLDPINNRIVYTGLIAEDYEEHISEYAQMFTVKPVEVLDGWLTLGDFIYRKR